MEPTTKNEQTVLRFCEAFSRRDIDELMTFFTDDAIYHNIPMAPAEGKDAIRSTLEMFVPGSPEISFEIRNVASSGDVVFTERVDTMVFNGNKVALPVAGVFEVEGDRIRAWRDYFDLQMFMSPSGQ